jgi:integrase/recombinase XerD
MSEAPIKRGLVPLRGGAQPPAVLQSPVKDFLSSFMEGNTTRAYTRDLQDFFRKTDLTKIPMREVMGIKPPDVASFRDELLLQKMKPGTVARKLSAVRAFFDYLLARGAVAFNPAHPKLVRAPKRPNLQKTDAISWNEALKILEAPDRSTPIGRRDYLLILLDIRTGLRRSELVSIRVEDIRPGPPAPHLYLKGKGEKERKVEIRPDLFEALEAYERDLEEKGGYLFPGNKGKHLTAGQFWRIVKHYAEAAGLPRRIHPHSLRAAFITFALEAGVPLPDVQRAGGHTRPETTLGYARDLEQVKSKAPRALDGLRAGAAPRDETER